jgi:hypothetical protein
MTPAIPPNALLVASGGARGVTAHCVIALAARYRCRFLLLGRSHRAPEPPWARDATTPPELKRLAAEALRAAGQPPTPTTIAPLVQSILAIREIDRTLSEIERAGGQAEYLSVDVTDRAALADTLRPALARLGPAAGLIHGAGALADRPIERKSEADFDRVYGTKVGGLANLLDCLPIEQLEHLVLFASAAGFYGNPGQSDYALANEVLNRVARLAGAASPRCRAVALNWGPWDGGMVDETLKRMFHRRGVDLIPAAEGARALIEVLEAEPRPRAVVVGGRLADRPASRPDRAERHRVWRRLTRAANPFLRDHVVGGAPVLPAVCAVQWLSGLGEEIYPGYRLFALDDFQVLKGIVFDADLAERYCLEIDQVEAADEQIVYRATIWSDRAGGEPRRHYRARVTLRREPPPPPRYLDLDLREDAGARDGAGLYRDGTLFHGPAFRGVERLLNASPTHLTLACRLAALDAAAQGQFPARSFNPYVADAQFQAQVVWGRLFRGLASLPLSCRRGEQYRPLPFDRTVYVSVDVRGSGEHGVTADLTSHDRDGRIHLRLQGAQVTLSHQLNPLFQPAGA